MPHPKGGYRVAGQKVPGVTTIIGRFKDSGALLWWAFEQGKCAERGEINSLYDKRDQAADAGTLAHAMVELHIKGDVPEKALTGVENAAVRDQATNAYLAFLAWKRQTGVKIIEQEIELTSTKYRYGGCPDAIGEIDGQLCLLDWKTSKGIYTDMIVQLAAYRALWEENFPLRPLTGGFHLCRFSKENGDFAHYHWPALPEAWESFKLMRQLYDLDAQLKKRV